jgi:hypothetical protein
VDIVDSGANYTATNVETALAEVMDAVQAHEADAADAHDASAVSIVDAGGFYTGTEVEAALAEVATNTKSIHLPSGVWVGVEGTPAEANYSTSAATSQGFGGITLDGTATYESVRTQFILPSDWVSGDDIKIRFALAVAAGAGQDVKLFYRVIARATGETIADTAGDFDAGNGTVSVASGAQYSQHTIDINPTITLAANDTIFIVIARDYNDATDDYANDIFIPAVRFDYLGSNV